MGKQTRKALSAIQAALEEQASEIAQHDTRLDRLEKIVDTQAKEIAALERGVMEMRNQSIKAAVGGGIPTKIVAQAHNVTPGRISQIAPRKPRTSS
ncbi:hypothetical protein [Lelliottia nimipressuralis]|uniref:Uncharacterized protein n=1 Tax=Lelliottia nimipressuralis TaxID=69220 RepID=A0ABY3NXK2_9ENTR|nr:hypothetical protein [Lelliottia nimipressuralis]RXJ10754.1 hypothetical protein ETG88_19665 [Lelliottia nimipressuralis]TYT29256.1 hypothetical protein FZO59_20950 [Lelliottia nimipressuralis]